MSQSPSAASPSTKSSSLNVGEAPVHVNFDSGEAAIEERKSRPRLAFAGVDAGTCVPSLQQGRRQSIQFAPSINTAAEVPKSRFSPSNLQRRLSSPPPPSTYESRVSFDTFVNRDATDLSFTLISKHKNFTYSRRSRTFLCGTDQNDYSEFALEWLVEELVEDGDEIICLRVVDEDSKISSDTSVQQGTYKAEARRLLRHIQAKNKDNKSISLVLDLAVGKVPETIQRMIKIYAPVCLVVGTRGRSLGGIQGILPGSVSKYCLQNSPVPVVVVRPQDKREKKKQKRLADPSRQTYSSILGQSGASGGSAFDTLASQPKGTATQNEAVAVAKAIGLKDSFHDWEGFNGESEEEPPVTTCATPKSDNVGESDSPSPHGPWTVEETFPGETDVGGTGDPKEFAASDEGQELDQTRDEADGKKAEEGLQNLKSLNLAESFNNEPLKSKEEEVPEEQ